MVTSDTASPEQKKPCSEHQNTPQALVQALFQAPKGTHTMGKPLMATHMKQASKQDKAEQEDNMNWIDQGKINTLKPKAKQLGDNDKQASSQPRQASTSDAGEALQETKLTDNNTHTNNAASMQDATARGLL